ncbi:5'-nucleotidase C-terminal domain-containing protein [Agromyces sp. ISL-38]|uniref:bifunctional metallophosphatase/5'-nucleotidase n=1 Tax=Agromyces sp. ISL-38 TaxID=2819107 RepID=UPI001BE4E6A9|nr:5'-nucleotidase C-terminal domain-containing protein [Agromyces sp. ISL-38]MBT2499369.1 5'-nucleotidase C-terminal domain-containing protein [Agromyces sp. ISL-38]
MRNHLKLATTTIAIAALTLVGLAPSLPAAAGPRADMVDIQVLNVSDFHGQLDPLNVAGVGNVGGAAALSTYWQQDRAENPNTLLLTAGDAVGASPPLSSFFDDVPTIDFMNYAGFNADTFGNHNFDKGIAHLQAQIDRAEFSYVSANLTNVEYNLIGVAPFVIKKVGGVKVAVIGVTNPEAPTLVAPGALGTIQITDPAAAANAARAQAEELGAKVFIAIGHLGIEGTDETGAPSGPLTEFANDVQGFDLILGDHTDVQYKSTINGALVLENLSKGATYAKTVLHYDRRGGGAVSASSQFIVPLSNAVTPDPNVVALLQPYRAELSAQLDGVIGVATDIFLRGSNIERIREVPLGDLTADALRTTYATQIAFTNGGGLRSSLPSSSYLPQDTTLRRPSPGYAAGPPYDVVIGDVFSVLPFGNESLTRTVTGAQLWAVLERSVGQAPNAFGGFLQISGFRFTYDSTQPVGARVLSVSLDDGTVIANDATTYTATTNDFTNAGGDGYVELADGQGVTRNLMANDLLAYITAQGTITPTTDGRIDDVARPDA